jgi:cytochrome c-type biogenesis protein CcmF
VPLVVLIGTAAVMAWKRTRIQVLRARLWAPLVAAVIVGVVLPWWTLGTHALAAVAGCVLGGWAICGALEDIVRRARGTRVKLTRQIAGQTLAHVGVGVFVIGVSLVSGLSSERDVRLAPGQSTTLAGYRFIFHGIEKQQGPNYSARTGAFSVARNGHTFAHIHPAKRRYEADGTVRTEAGIDDGIFRDLYISLGQPLAGRAWSVRIYYRPFVRWIWAGGFLAALGGLLALSDKRYWRREKLRRGVKARPRAQAVDIKEPLIHSYTVAPESLRATGKE